jgi:hypothetical protein
MALIPDLLTSASAPRFQETTTTAKATAGKDPSINMNGYILDNNQIMINYYTFRDCKERID